MSDIPPLTGPMIAKIAGAFAGAAISLAYLLPRSKRDAATRFVAGMISGVVFGGTAGITVAERLEITELLGETETALMGSALASLTLWWVLGFALRLAERALPNSDRNSRRMENKTDE